MIFFWGLSGFLQRVHFPEGLELDGDCAEEGQGVCRRLGHLYAGEAQGVGQDIDQGDEEDALARSEERRVGKECRL